MKFFELSCFCVLSLFMSASGDTECNFAEYNLSPVQVDYCNYYTDPSSEWGSLKAQCSGDGSYANITQYSDYSCQNVISVTYASTFECGNVGCNTIRQVYKKWIGTSICSGSADYEGVVYYSNLVDYCASDSSTGNSILYNCNSNGCFWEYYFEVLGCSGSTDTTWSDTNADCVYVSYDNAAIISTFKDIGSAGTTNNHTAYNNTAHAYNNTKHNNTIHYNYNTTNNHATLNHTTLNHTTYNDATYNNTKYNVSTYNDATYVYVTTIARGNGGSDGSGGDGSGGHGSDNSDCNFVVLDGNYGIIPLQDGQCGYMTNPNAEWSSIKAQCSNNGNSATITYYSDTSCNNAINVTNADHFECGNNGCNTITYLYEQWLDTNTCSGDADYQAKIYFSNVEDYCLDISNSAILLTANSDGFYYSLWNSSNCGGTLYGKYNITDTGCRSYASNSTRITFTESISSNSANIFDCNNFIALFMWFWFILFVVNF